MSALPNDLNVRLHDDDAAYFLESSVLDDHGLRATITGGCNTNGACIEVTLERHSRDCPWMLTDAGIFRQTSRHGVSLANMGTRQESRLTRQLTDLGVF